MGQQSSGSTPPRDEDAPARTTAPLGGDGPRVEAARRLAPAPGSNPVLNRLAELATVLLRTTAAQVSVLTEVQTVTAAAGLAGPSVGAQIPLAEALCTVTAVVDGPMVVADAANDTRVADREAVTSGVVGSYLGVPLTSEDGEVVGALCVFEPLPRDWSEDDVALLCQLAGFAALALQSSTAITGDDARRILWELSVAAAGIGTFDWDVTTGRLVWDDRLVELFGYQRGQFGESIEDFDARVHPADLPDVTARLQAAIDAGGDYEATYRVVVPGGPMRWVVARGRALRDPDGTTARILGAAWDVTASHEAAAEVAEIVEDLAVGFFAVDTAWCFTHVNAAFEQIAGMAREEVLGRSVWEVFPPAVGTIFEDAYRGAVAGRETVTFEAYYPDPLDVWVEVRAVPTASGLSVYFLDITDRRRAQDLAETTAQRASLVASVTSELAEHLDADDAVARLAALVVPTLADWCLVTLVDDDAAATATGTRGLRDIGCSHVDPGQSALVEAYAGCRLPALRKNSYVAQALASSEPIELERGATARILDVLAPGEAQDLLAALAPESFVVLPLRARGRTVGLLSLFRSATRAAMTAEELVIAREVAGRAGLALDNARLYRQQRDLAEGLQRSLLTDPPEPDHVQVVVRYSPAAQAAQVGGDWYDAFFQTNGSTVLVIGDVVGHDTQAAAAMSQVRTMVRAIGAATGVGPAELLTTVDHAMQTLRVDTTATAIVARVEQTASERRRGVTHLRWSNAGHPPAMVINPDATVTAIGDLRADLLLGVMPDTRRHEHEIALDRGATVLMYTDGLVERRGQSLDIGLERLQDVLEDLAGEGVDLDSLCDQVLARMLPPAPEDDVALVAVRLHPQDELRPPEAGPRVLPDDIADEPAVIDQPD